MAHIVHLIDRLCIGGAQSLLVTLAQAMRGRRHTMSVISLHHEDEMGDQLRALRIPVTVLPGKLRDLSRIGTICRYLARSDARVLHCHLGYANITGAVCGQIMGLPVVTSLHSMQDHRMGRPWSGAVHWLDRWCLRHLCDRLIAVGPHVAIARRGHVGAAPMVVIENAVVPPEPLSAEQREDIRATLMPPEADPRRSLLYIAVGRLSPEKGFADLLEAFAIFGRGYPHAYLAIAGGGELMEELAAKVAALGLSARVRLLGPRGDVPALLAASDVLVMPSHWEGLPVAVLEGMAAGLPVIATEVGDLPNIVSPEVGLLVPARQPVTLAGAMASLATAGADREAMGLIGQRVVAARYSPSVWADRLCELYDEVMNERGIGRRAWFPHGAPMGERRPSM